MKKLYSLCLVLAALFQLSVTASQLEIQKNLRRDGFERDWKQPLRELAVGSGLFGASYLLPHDYHKLNAQDMVTVTSVGLLIDALEKIATNVTEAYGEKIGLAQIEALKRRLHRTNAQELLSRYVYPKIQATRLARSYCSHTLNLLFQMTVLLWMSKEFYAAEDAQTALKAYVVWLAILCAGIVYNAIEIHHAYTTKTTRNDRPIARVANGIAQVALSQYIGVQGGDLLYVTTIIDSTGEIQVSRVPMFPFLYTLYRFFQTHSDYEFFLGGTHVLWNLLSHIRELRNRKTLVEELPARTPVRPSPSAKRNRLSDRSAHTEVPVRLVADPEKPEASESEVDQAPRVKVKTRKQAPDENNNEPALGEMVEAVETILPAQVTENDRARQEALDRLQELDRKRTVSVEEMNEEINRMLRLLPHAKLASAGHRKQAIILTFSNGGQYRVTYETPHLQRFGDDNEYRAARKERVIDALRVCYLCGWKEELIKDFMRRNNIISFINLPAFLVHILWERGKES